MDCPFRRLATQEMDAVQTRKVESNGAFFGCTIQAPFLSETAEEWRSPRKQEAPIWPETFNRPRKERPMSGFLFPTTQIMVEVLDFHVLMGPIALTMALNRPSCISQAAFVQLQLNQPSTINHVGLVGHDLMGVEHVPNKNAHQLGRPFLVPSRLSST